uniref:F-box domain-containing protein n=1 Tax=Romanomermis culicivorax TaxID=13658 RepID=A0A915I127_ROMCU
MNENLSTINFLPDDILSIIFSHLEVADRLLYLPYVCKKWHRSLRFSDVRYCDIFDLHEQICLLDFDCPSQRKIIKKDGESSAPSVENDSTSQSLWLCTFAGKILKKFGHSLKRLSLEGTCRFRMKNISSHVLQIILRKCPKITELNLLQCRFDRTAAYLLPEFQNLEILRVSKQEMIDCVWNNLKSTLKCLDTSCESFGVNFSTPNDEVGAASKLQKLIIYDYNYSLNIGKIALTSIVEIYANLVHLDIQSCRLDGYILDSVAKLKLLKVLCLRITKTTNPSVFRSICQECSEIRELTLLDEYSDGHLNFEFLLYKLGGKLEKFHFQSSRTISDVQLGIIKKLTGLKALVLWTKSLPALDVSLEPSQCSKLEELTISATNRDEQAYQYSKFMNASLNFFTRIGYLPKGWSLPDSCSGIPVEVLLEYASNNVDGCIKLNVLEKLMIHVQDSAILTQLVDIGRFDNLSGLIIFGQCQLGDELASKIIEKCPRLTFFMCRELIEISPQFIANILQCSTLRETHFEYKNLSADEIFCRAIGRHPNLKMVSFKGRFNPLKLRLQSRHWHEIMQGRLELFKSGRVCQRLFVDCYYEQKIWPVMLAKTMRSLWLSCRGLKALEEM